MANKKISELTELRSPKTTDSLPIVDGSDSSTKKISVRTLQAVPDGSVDDPGFKFISGGGIYKGSDGTFKSTNHFAPPLTVSERSSAVTLATGDAGKMLVLKTAGIGVKVPENVLNPGEAVVIVNNVNGDNVISQQNNVSIRVAGETATGNVDMKAYASCTLLCIAANQYWAFGVKIS